MLGQEAEVMVPEEEQDQVVEVEGEFYNVREQYALYDTIAIASNVDDLSTVPDGWYTTFAAFGGATNHSFFNVRNRGGCERAYCNLDARDNTSFAFMADAISLSFFGSGFGYFNETGGWTRHYLQNALWQAQLPFEASLTFIVQQDIKLKLNCLMANSGYGPVGGGYGNMGYPNAGANIQGTIHPNLTTMTQGIASPYARIKFPTVINIPRRAHISAELSFTPWGRAVLGLMPGPFEVPIVDPNDQAYAAPIMFGVQCALHGRRLVQQRGALHA